MKLHKTYLENMKKLLGNAFDDFMDSYEDDRIRGIRVNTLKISVEDFLKISPYELEPIPWTTDGFYVDEKERPGKHPYWHAGLYYIQEPSAMLPGSLLDVAPDHRVLDLCASPGGKTLQIAAKLSRKGLLVTNDISSGRIKPLIRNIEQFGVINAVVVNDRHDKLSQAFEGAFDRVLVDAPCSGEGMFRKDDGLIRDWTPDSNDQFHAVQTDILDHAGRMLKSGGQLLYSTCTFSPKENEQVIETLLNNEDGYKFVELGALSGGIVTDGGKARIWPHLSRGEGHFAAVLQKGEPISQADANVYSKPVAECVKQNVTLVSERMPKNAKAFKSGSKNSGSDRGSSSQRVKPALEKQSYQGFDALPEVFKEFAQTNFNPQSRIMTLLENAQFEFMMDRLNRLPELTWPLENIRVVRQGLQLGEIVQGRFKPSQALVMALEADDFRLRMDFEPDDSQLHKYLKGDTLMLETERPEGLYLITVSGYPLGLGKSDGKSLKNLYPPAWRMQ